MSQGRFFSLNPPLDQGSLKDATVWARQVEQAINQLHDMLFDHMELPAAVETADDLREAVITVRMPRELHKELKRQAHENQLSLNQYCLLKLRSACRVSQPKREC